MTELINVVYEPVEANWGIGVSETGLPIPTELVIVAIGLGLAVMLVGLTAK